MVDPSQMMGGPGGASAPPQGGPDPSMLLAALAAKSKGKAKAKGKHKKGGKRRGKKK